jgi:hypothetical protein
MITSRLLGTLMHVRDDNIKTDVEQADRCGMV